MSNNINYNPGLKINTKLIKDPIDGKSIEIVKAKGIEFINKIRREADRYFFVNEKVTEIARDRSFNARESADKVEGYIKEFIDSRKASNNFAVGDDINIRNAFKHEIAYRRDAYQADGSPNFWKIDQLKYVLGRRGWKF